MKLSLEMRLPLLYAVMHVRICRLLVHSRNPCSKDEKEAINCKCEPACLSKHDQNRKAKDSDIRTSFSTSSVSTEDTRDIRAAGKSPSRTKKSTPLDYFLAKGVRAHRCRGVLARSPLRSATKARTHARTHSRYTALVALNGSSAAASFALHSSITPRSATPLCLTQRLCKGSQSTPTAVSVVWSWCLVYAARVSAVRTSFSSASSTCEHLHGTDSSLACTVLRHYSWAYGTACCDLCSDVITAGVQQVCGRCWD